MLLIIPYNSQNNAQAEQNSGKLCVSVNEILNTQKDILKRLERLEIGMDAVGSDPVAGGDDLDTTSLYSLRNTISRETVRNMISKFSFSFDTTLKISGVYQRAHSRYPVFQTDSKTSSIAAQSMGWSFMSGLSISDISQVSVLSLPIYPCDMPNNQSYTFGREIPRSVALIENQNTTQILLERPPSPKYRLYRARNHLPSLHSAAKDGDKDMVKSLIDNGVDISADNSFGLTALYIATENGHKDVVQLLLENGADISAANYFGLTALHIAVRRGHKDVVQLLLENGADVSTMSTSGSTALHVAAQNGRGSTALLLLKNGADLSAETTLANG
jgi:hypothetical protein